MCRRQGSARAQVFGDHGTVWAQGPLEIQLWAFLQALVGVGSRHPDETRDTFTTTGFHGRYPATVLRDWVRKLGMGFCTAHPTLRSASVCVLYFIIFNYFIIPLITCKWTLINFQILILAQVIN